MSRIIDSHCHIYPEKIAEKAVNMVVKFYEGLPTAHHDGTTRTLIESGKAAGISQFVVHSVATTPRQVSSINHFISEAVKNSGGMFTGLGAMHPESEDPEADLKEILSLGLSGVKLHPDFQEFPADSIKAFRMYEIIEDFGVPLLIHAGDYRYDYSNPGRLSNILKSFPRMQVVAAHLGGWSMWEKAAHMLPDYPNLMVDTSSSFNYMTKERSREIIRIYGAGRVLFGTDYPLWMQGEELDRLRGMELTDEEYERICWKNAAELYHIADLNTDNNTKGIPCGGSLMEEL